MSIENGNAVEQRTPSRKAQGVVALGSEILRGKMHARHGAADFHGMFRRRLARPDALKKSDEGGMAAGDLVENLALAVMHGERTRHAALKEMLHES